MMENKKRAIKLFEKGNGGYDDAECKNFCSIYNLDYCGEFELELNCSPQEIGKQLFKSIEQFNYDVALLENKKIPFESYEKGMNIIEFLNSMNIELVEVPTELALIKIKDEVKRGKEMRSKETIAFLCGNSKGESTFHEDKVVEMLDYCRNHKYSVRQGCGLCMEDVCDLQFCIEKAKEANASIIVINSIDSFMLKRDMMEEFVELASEEGIVIESVKEGQLTPQPTHHPTLRFMS